MYEEGEVEEIIACHRFLLAIIYSKAGMLPPVTSKSGRG
jgi:hypothetical protein